MFDRSKFIDNEAVCDAGCSEDEYEGPDDEDEFNDFINDGDPNDVNKTDYDYGDDDDDDSNSIDGHNNLNISSTTENHPKSGNDNSARNIENLLMNEGTSLLRDGDDEDEESHQQLVQEGIEYLMNEKRIRSHKRKLKRETKRLRKHKKLMTKRKSSFRKFKKSKRKKISSITKKIRELKKLIKGM